MLKECGTARCEMDHFRFPSLSGSWTIYNVCFASSRYFSRSIRSSTLRRAPATKGKEAEPNLQFWLFIFISLSLFFPPVPSSIGEVIFGQRHQERVSGFFPLLLDILSILHALRNCYAGWWWRWRKRFCRDCKKLVFLFPSYQGRTSRSCASTSFRVQFIYALYFHSISSAKKAKQKGQTR